MEYIFIVAIALYLAIVADGSLAQIAVVVLIFLVGLPVLIVTGSLMLESGKNKNKNTTDVERATNRNTKSKAIYTGAEYSYTTDYNKGSGGVIASSLDAPNHTSTGPARNYSDGISTDILGVNMSTDGTITIGVTSDVSVDSNGNFNYSVDEGLTLHSDGSYTSQVCDGVSIRSDGQVSVDAFGSRFSFGENDGKSSDSSDNGWWR